MLAVVVGAGVVTCVVVDPGFFAVVVTFPPWRTWVFGGVVLVVVVDDEVVVVSSAEVVDVTAQPGGAQ